MALIVPQAIAVTGTAPTFTAPTATDTIAPRDRGVLIIRTTGTATTATITIPGNDVLGQARPDVAVSVGATAVHAIPMAPYVAFSDTNGICAIAFSGALTGVTAAYLTI